MNQKVPPVRRPELYCQADSPHDVTFLDCLPVAADSVPSDCVEIPTSFSAQSKHRTCHTAVGKHEVTIICCTSTFECSVTNTLDVVIT